MSPPEVTITLGRSGQVVKRKRTDTDGEQSFSYNSSVRKRFGTHGDASFSSYSKRQREVDDKEHVSRDRENGLHLDRNDLRHKLIQRRLYSERHVSAGGHERREKVKREFSGAPAVARSSLSTNVFQHGPQSSRDRRFQVNPCREVDGDLLYVEPSRNYFSTGTRDDFRRRSPAKPTYNSSRLLPPNYETEMPKTTLTRTIDPLGNERAYSISLHGPPRSTAPAPPAHMIRLTEFVRAKPVALFSSPGGTIPRSLFTAEVPVTVVGLLNSLGLGKYAINFQVEEVDMPSLKQMGEKDLKDLGIPMGPRKKILQALTALSKRPLPRTR